MRTLLIIEDEEALRSTLADRLELEGFHVHTAENGEEGIWHAREHHPDLILCDILMPEMDGYGVFRALQEDPATAVIPFIFLTARTDPPEVRAGMVLGADDYLCKPVAKADLLAAIHARLRKRRGDEARLARETEAARLEVVRRLPHELLTPLSGLISASQLLEHADPSQPVAEVRELGRIIRLASERLHRTIHRLLLYAELQSGDPTSPAHSSRRSARSIPATLWVVTQAREIARRDARLEDLQMDLAEVDLVMDPAHLAELVTQLVENAFKFSPPGSVVQVRLALVNDAAVLVVRDQGRGMTAEQIRSVAAFRQFDREVLEQPGTGLGLALVHQLAALHGGGLTLESEPGNGTRATVRLPGARPGKASPGAGLDAELQRQIAWSLGTRPD